MISVQTTFNGVTTVTLKGDSERDKAILGAAFSEKVVRVTKGTEGEIVLVMGKSDTEEKP